MPRYRTPRPLTATKPKRFGRPDLRDYDTIRNPGNRPSEQFDWDAALYLFALGMWSLGYKLSKEQQKRIENSARNH